MSGRSSFPPRLLVKAMAAFTRLLLFLFLLLLFSSVSKSAKITIENNCGSEIWPGILSSGGTSNLPTGFSLLPAQPITFEIVEPWLGSLWGRTNCSRNAAGKFLCLTGDCASSTVECGGRSPAQPATLAEWKLNGANGPNLYNVSNKNGYNLPMMVGPKDGSGSRDCTMMGCMMDLDEECPDDLKVRSSDGIVVACRPAKQSVDILMTSCLRAYNQAFDGTATLTCSSTDYLATFCPHSEADTSGDLPSHTQAPPPQTPP